MLRHELPTVGQVRIVDLQQKTGIGNGLVFLVHGISDGDQIGLVVGVIIVFHPVLDGAGSDGGEKSFLVFLSLQTGLEVGDLRFQRCMADVFQRRIAEYPLDIVATVVGARFKIVAELDQIPGIDGRGVVAGFGFAFDEAAQTVARIAGKVGFALIRRR